MKKPKVERLTVKIPMYFAQIEFYICDDYEEIAKFVPVSIKSEVADWEGVGACHYLKFSGGNYPFRPTIQMRSNCIETAAHEIIHACAFILKKAGIPTDSNNGEPLAYVFDFVFNKYLAKFWDIK
jgi:hypothetical protein